MQREAQDGDAANGDSRFPGFQNPALPVAEQLQALQLQDDIAGMPLGQVVGLIRLAVAEKHVNATESEIRDEAERRWLDSHPGGDEEDAEPHHEYIRDEDGNLPTFEPKPEDRAESDSLDSAAEPLSPSETEPTVSDFLFPEQREAIQAEANCTAEMSLSMITDRVREACRARGIEDDVTDAEIVSMAEAIWDAFSINRKGPRVATVEPDGTVRDWRRPETTPDRGEGVGETHRTITDDDEPRFSGGGASDRPGPSKLVPSDGQFGGKAYREAPELAQLASDLIEKHGYLDHLEHATIRYFWKRKTGTVKRQRVLGGLKRGSDLFGYLLGSEFAIFLAADTARERGHTDRRVERSLFRQLRRIGQDDKGNWIELPFSMQLFTEEIQEYADLDDEDLKAGRNAYRTGEQLGLFERDDEEDDEDLEDDGAGVLIHADGTPMTADEIAEQEAAELRDDDMDDDASDSGASDEGQEEEDILLDDPI